MGKKTRKQEFNFPNVAQWVPYKPYSKDKEKILKEAENDNELVEVPENWKEPEFNPEDNPHKQLFAKSSFYVMFPSYREKYLNEIWPAVKKLLLEFHIKAELDLADSKMSVSTTPKTYDPFMIIKARDMIRMLARSVPFDEAKRLLDNEIFGEIIELKLGNKARFVKRRNRLIGEDGETLKAIEMITGCYVLVQGKTVSVIGDHTGVLQVQKLVNSCMYDNIHPAYAIKRLIILRKLSADPSKKNLSWDNFLPKIKKKVLSKRKKPKKVRKKSEYTPFPPPIEKSKVDLALEKGYYFLDEQERKEMEKSSKIAASKETSRKRQKEKRELALLPPEERKKRKLSQMVE